MTSILIDTSINIKKFYAKIDDLENSERAQAWAQANIFHANAHGFKLANH